MKLSIQLLTWNGEQYLVSLFASLKKQTFTDWELLILDNGSTDRSAEKVRELTRDMQHVRFSQQKENVGFSAGHNRLFEEGSGEYVLILNQDIILELDCVAKLVTHLDAHPKTAAVAPRLMRLGAEGMIDSLGLAILPNRRVVEEGQGELWSAWKAKRQKEIDTLANANPPTLIPLDVKFSFGVSAACAMYRRRAVQETGYLFDELYFSYKEDVDLAYRLQFALYDSDVLLDAVAYHARTAAGQSDLSDTAAAANKKKQSDLVKYHSYKNHLMNLYKNESLQTVNFTFPFILWYELKKFLYFLLFDPKVLKGWGEIWRHRRELRLKWTRNFKT